eukprot:CAMPEP_0118688362 /NCGR_PEP_ID=MMETSP0800-20121206/8877_1 /TAXON_ID=210618 ORGANISM="Striatella unipunctata, Strain CCMP2910" /NCGR_SAMPLE_ID=MMETSP0800 /ASSEMBLY_ACC=CAM_ASM_000638 /LENGTH=226 /DNA_ID=CAMNT_0006585611 /DNA_START=13 /DNA_END=693 /DNA_ORIENTATION=+
MKRVFAAVVNGKPLLSARRAASQMQKPHLVYCNRSIGLLHNAVTDQPPVSRMTFATATTQRTFSMSSHIIEDDEETDSETKITKRHVPIARESRRTFVPRKAPIEITENARNILTALLGLTKKNDVVGIMLGYDQSSTGEPRMVFSLNFVTEAELTQDDEGVSLVDHESDSEASAGIAENKPKLYIHRHAFMKVLGGSLDIDLVKETGDLKPVLKDREGNLMDPNA